MPGIFMHTVLMTYKLYIIHADQWNADKVVRIDIWREKE